MEEERMEEERMEEEKGMDYNDYIDAIKELKKSTVSKEEYDKLVQEKRTLVETLVNGKTDSSTDEEEAEEKVSLQQLKKELFTPEKELSDLEYCKKAIELRKRVLEETGEDCFVGASHSYSPTRDDYEKAEKTAKVIEECIEDSNGNNGRFMAALQSRINDVFIPSKR